MPSARGNGWIALLLCLATTLLLLVASRNEGFTRDEGYYFDAAELHAAWYEELAGGLAQGSLKALSRPVVDRYFGYNHEHPPLMKTLFGLSWRYLHRCDCPRQTGRHPLSYARPHPTLALLSEADALRLPAHLFGGILVAIAFLFGASAFSRRAGLVAAVLALAAPRYFFHAELSCFDAPMATTWLLTVYLYWRALLNRRWAPWAGIAFGLALATKHNAFFLPFLLLAHYLWVRWRCTARRKAPPSAAVFGYLVVLGPLVYVALWPWLWYDSVARFREYVAFHLHHVYYNFEFLGRNYNKPPFPRSFPFVMTALTAPVTTLALGLVGTVALLLGPRLGRWLARFPQDVNGDASGGRASPPPPPVRIWQPAAVGLAAGAPRPQTPRGAPGMLVFLNALFPPAIITLTGAPIFGATKHFLPMIPFLALLAGVGAAALFEALASAMQWNERRQKVAFATALVIACAPAAAETYRSHPYGLTHYNQIAGGPAGGADLGLNRQFWGYSTRGILPWLNLHAPRNASVYWHDTNQAILNMDVRAGLLRDDFLNTEYRLEEPGVKSSSLAMVIHEKHFNKYEYWIWDFYGTARPSLVLTDEGVPIVTLYERPQAPATPPSAPPRPNAPSNH